MAYDNDMAVVDANGATVQIVTKGYTPREVQVVELGYNGSLVGTSNRSPVTAVIESGTATVSGDVGLDPIPSGATYFRYQGRKTVGNDQVFACPAGGHIVVQNIRVRSKSDSSATVIVFFDMNNNGGAFEAGTDSAVEDVDLESSATSHPGSNSGPMYERGAQDIDLRYEVQGAGTVSLMVQGYTTPN